LSCNKKRRGLLTYGRSVKPLAELKILCIRGRATRKGCRSEGDSESNIRLADVCKA
jgi:hypothetical protein